MDELKVGDEVLILHNYYSTTSYEVRAITKTTPTLYVVNCGNCERRFYKEPRFWYGDAEKANPYFTERSAHSYGSSYKMLPMTEKNIADYKKWKAVFDRKNLITKLREIKIRDDITNERLQEIIDELAVKDLATNQS